jgi:hypothetical protein
MPTCSGCWEKQTENFADYAKEGRLYFCDVECLKKYHVGVHKPLVQSPEQKHTCINAIVEEVVDHRTLSVTFIPYGLSFVHVNIMQYREGVEDIDYDQDRYDVLSEMLDPIVREDGLTYYAICHIDITDVKDGNVRGVVIVPHGCRFDEDTLMAICPEGGKLLNLSKVMTGMADRKMSDATMETYRPEAENYVGDKHAPQRYRTPMHIKVVPHRFTNYAKSHHLMKGKANRIPEKAIQHVLHDPRASTHVRREAQFAENARHWNHHHGRHHIPSTPGTDAKLPMGIKGKK